MLAALLAGAGCSAQTRAGDPTTPDAPTREAGEVAWRDWSPEAFEQARSEGRHILVSVQASWCHWCHVMNDETFGDPRVQGLLADGWVAIKVDSDARPDLAERFQDYAWPATILMSPEAAVVLPLRGYRSPEVFAGLLEDVRAGREVEDEEPIEPRPIDDLAQVRLEARADLDQLFDEGAGGWGEGQKYPYGAPVEHGLFRLRALGEAAWAGRLEQTLEGHAALLDPVFGGIYQYSLPGTGEDRLRGVSAWTNPHYEKITGVQADALQVFAQACQRDGGLTDPGRWCDRARDVQRYVERFLTDPDGGFYTSQDADLDHETVGRTYYALEEDARLARGVPRVDRAIYADLNGRMIVALVALDDADATAGALDLALRSAEHVEARLRGQDALLFAHGGSSSVSLRYLADTAWMLRAELALYESTGDARWLERARRSARGLETLRSASGALYAHTEDPQARGDFRERRTPLALNGVAARGLLRLHRHTGDAELETLALGALRGVADAGELRRRGRRIGEYVLALEELEAPWVMVSVVGPDDESTRRLHRAARGLAQPNVLVELGRPGESRYPYPGRASAYLCTASTCSQPIQSVLALSDTADRLLITR